MPFLLFNDLQEISGLVAASAQEAHVIKGKRVSEDTYLDHRYFISTSQATCKKAEVRQGKIYVGKLPPDEISNQDLTDHFNQVGAVIHFEWRRHRNFIFA